VRQASRVPDRLPIDMNAVLRKLNALPVDGVGNQRIEGTELVATITDVARRAGVSVSTVSHVINKTRHVNADTAALVREAIDALGFMPSAVARSLKRSETNAIGVAVSTSTNSYFMDIVRALEQACTDLGQMVFLANTGDDPETELRAVRALHQQRVDGIILAPSADPQRRAVRYLADHKVPCVLVDRLLDDEDLDQVGITNRLSMETLVEHLIARGHRRIGYLAGQPDFATTRERLEGYRAAMGKHGLAIDSEIVHTGNPTVDAARDAARAILGLADRPTAIATGNNLATIGAMQAIRAAGLRVPEDIAIAGIDDFEWADCFEPRLTVMAQPCAEIGHQAAVLLSKRIKDNDRPRTTVRLEPTLIVRNSCGSRQ
jgi:LacI family transcriptional regulator